MELVSMGWTSETHSRLSVSLCLEIVGKLRDDFAKKKMFFSHGSTRLVHYGDRLSDCAYLIDISEIADHENFITNEIQNFHSVEPDVLLFHKNKYIQNKVGTYLAGFPDLVVEIWSTSNGAAERKYKNLVYSSSPTTEHWYFEQNSDFVEMWLGKNKLGTAPISKKLTTQNGLELDISDILL